MATMPGSDRTGGTLAPVIMATRASPVVSKQGPITFPCFEGLRALAAMMVVVHHAASLAGPESTPHAIRVPAEVMDSGVAVFFVLSGFLIYRPFAAAHHGGRPLPASLAFWWRRLLRLVPAYWLALTFFWVIGSFELGRDWWRYYLPADLFARDRPRGARPGLELVHGGHLLPACAGLGAGGWEVVPRSPPGDGGEPGRVRCALRRGCGVTVGDLRA